MPASTTLKVRIGFGLGTSTSLNDERFGHVVDELERLKFDSLWVSERIRTAAPDPLVAMAFAAGRTTKLKFGMSVMVLPGRNPVVLAKALASLATLSGGRLLPAFGLGAVDPHEQQAFGVERGERAAWFDESFAVMRKCWTGEPFDHQGERYHYEGLRVLPAPRRVDVWLGGIARSELRRVGRLADGWLPSFVTPADVAAGRATIEAVAAEHGRSIDDDHYGVLIPYHFGGDSSGFIERIANRRPDIDPADVVATSWHQLRELIGRFIEVGASKFVVIPAGEPNTTGEWTDHLETLAAEILPLET
ncbi:MAG TPA: TIGR03854 family LLM class F420-dependent oxidoreductase [Ilumatobacter sp.]|nr:TIGR03854 family LLM class F420-dependent oxidoreductase [Ilumatobacter sp.]